ncbi:unnamed protein product [Bursaphelenchus okinawaensis]|uniref:protein-tyrosine-phosphatase n=1 Tax=Bursaphelenchus okinawaensis TaxID=465554 RepID=A0A811L9K9_9BILA|nr:unnamed protein product [Bursaphelenchus okinawaensis]CAG9119798.1 unnamed protein product [Bursaphelenchus okinawaensis]
MSELRLTDFYCNVSGDRARELLFLYGSKGEFLIRPSESNPFDHTISIHRGGRVTHVKLSGKGGIHRLPTGDEFINLCALVQHLMDTPNLLCEKDGVFIEVTHPVKIAAPESVVNIGQDRFFHIDINGLEAEELLSEEPNGTFLIRESTSVPGEYALSVKNEDTTLHVRIYHDENKFRIVPKDNFRSLAELIENYKNIPMVQYTGTVVKLKQPLLSTKFTAASVDDRIEALIKTAKKPNARDGIAEEFDKIHHDKSCSLYVSCKEGRKPENVRKNRYRNVVPFDHTRIKLRPLDPETATSEFSDYVNANLVKVLSNVPCYSEFTGIEKRYISTQGCLQHTIGDFWHMIWQENVRIIVMTTKETERGRLKCSVYWPNRGEEHRYGQNHEFRVRLNREESKGEYVVRQLELAYLKKGESIPTAVRHVYHYQFLAWEDNGCPSDAVLIFMEEINRCAVPRCPPDCGPMLVHCSAGIGRTGTYIVLDILIEKIKQIGPHCSIDIPKTVRMVREQRATMVQTEAQYRFIYYAISTYMKMWRKEHALNEITNALPPPTVPYDDPDDELESNEEYESEEDSDGS